MILLNTYRFSCSLRITLVDQRVSSFTGLDYNSQNPQSEGLAVLLLGVSERRGSIPLPQPVLQLIGAMNGLTSVQ